MTIVTDSSALVEFLLDYSSVGRWVEDAFTDEDLAMCEEMRAEMEAKRMGMSGKAAV